MEECLKDGRQQMEGTLDGILVDVENIPQNYNQDLDKGGEVEEDNYNLEKSMTDDVSLHTDLDKVALIRCIHCNISPSIGIVD